MKPEGPPLSEAALRLSEQMMTKSVTDAPRHAFDLANINQLQGSRMAVSKPPPSNSSGKIG
jgi:hypothetical protein